MNYDEWVKLIEEVSSKEENYDDIEIEDCKQHNFIGDEKRSLPDAFNIQDVKNVEECIHKDLKYLTLDDYIIRISFRDGKYRVKVYETVRKLKSGVDCNMNMVVNMGKHYKFKDSGIAKLFDYFNWAEVTKEELVEIVNYVKAVNRLTLFL